MWGGRRDRDKRASLPCPFLYDAQHRRARRIFHLDPASHATAAVRKVAAFRDDALKAKLACVRQDDRAVAVEMLGEANPVAPHEQLFELALAQFERRRPQVLAVQLDQIEPVEEDVRVQSFSRASAPSIRR